MLSSLVGDQIHAKPCRTLFASYDPVFRVCFKIITRKTKQLIRGDGRSIMSKIGRYRQGIRPHTVWIDARNLKGGKEAIRNAGILSLRANHFDHRKRGIRYFLLENFKNFR